MTPPPKSKIQLPEWYAEFDLSKRKRPLTKKSKNAQEFICDPLKIINPAAGCDIYTFGKDRLGPGPGLALFDGYFLNRKDLVVELGLKKNVISDSEILFAAYAKWGEQLFNHLRGAFLAAVWDPSKNSLILGRDAMGHHPLYYTQEKDVLSFSSNIFSLAYSNPQLRKPNRLSSALLLIGLWPPRGQTYFERINRLPPGNYIQSTQRENLKIIEYWDPIPDVDEPWLQWDYVEKNFEETLYQNTAAYIDLGARGIMLSGGIDSVSIAALASKYTQTNGLDPLIAYSGRNPPPSPLNYEDKMQDVVVERLCMPHRTSSTDDWLDGREVLTSTLDVCIELPSPTDIWWTSAYMGFYKRAISEGVDVFLTGSGGDEWLGVSSYHATDLIRGFNLPGLWRFIKSEKNTRGVTNKSILRGLIYKKGLAVIAGGIWKQFAPELKSQYRRNKIIRSLPNWLCPDINLKNDLIDYLENMAMPELSDKGKLPKSYYKHTIKHSIKNPLITHEFERRFHVSSSLGIRLLSPYHDPKLVEFFNRISPEQLLLGNNYKGLLRPLAEKYLPGLGLDKQRKITTSTEDDEWTIKTFRTQIPALFEKLGCNTLANLDIVDNQGLAIDFANSQQFEIPRLGGLFTLLCTEKWLGTHTA